MFMLKGVPYLSSKYLNCRRCPFLRLTWIYIICPYSSPYSSSLSFAHSFAHTAHIQSPNMPKDTVESEDCPPPPYMPHVGSGDDDAKVQQQEGCTTSKDNSSTWWRRALRRVLAPSRQALRKQEPNSDTPPTVAPSVDSSHAIPHWSGHNGMTCGRGATSTKRPLPRAPHPSCHLYSLDVMCCPPPSTPVSEGPVSEGATRWQQARLSFTSDNLPEILRGPPIPWRANLEDCCYVDMVDFCYYPYPVPFFTQQPDSGKVKVYYHNDTTRRNGLSVSVGGHIYERTISLALAFKTGESYWRLRLLITSRDGDWLASLSRADAAALVGLDTVIR
ncbi:hypothetical protein B0T17DRAFT_350733 [Bombardia bombarda]|uniref:Uncharacterized protein n=1 Tax=Bombardia bombarda TaxID=252184 RepID=A0AA39WHU4_9PEZI|nr:hypothetical protein B0T17DRAFT_350733 [Bombardia bombarda]